MDNQICCFENGKECTALKDKACFNCSFFTTQQEFDKGTKDTFKRLAKVKNKIYYYDKYYIRDMTLNEFLTKIREAAK